jgi:uncharacterized metal-binding protein YceD (DUF177 family)
MQTMTRRKPEHISKWPWTVPLAIADVPETGKHLDVAADEQARAAIATLAELRALPRLEASFDVTLRGRDGLRVTGVVSATVGQVCVVTLDPVDNEIDEEIDLAFAPGAAAPPSPRGAESEDGPEPLIGGMVDLGAIATEFLLLALDPYPRKPDAVFEAPVEAHDGAHPFSALAALKKDQRGAGS